MSNQLFLRNARLAVSRLIGCVSKDAACLAIEGMSPPAAVRSYDQLVEYMNLIEVAKEAPNMQSNKNNVELSESDEDFIRSLTGNDGQGKLLLEEQDIDDEDEESMDSFSYVEGLGISVKEKLSRNKQRNRLEILSFPFGDGEASVQANRAWLKAKFGTLGAYAEAILGKKEAKAFLNTLKKLEKDPDERRVTVDNIVGAPAPEIPELVEGKRPGKAWLQEHKLLRSDLMGMDKAEHKLRWDAVDQAQGYTLKDGRMDDEIEDERMARKGWVYDEEGNGRYIGFSIPYLREKDENGEKHVVEITTDKGTMKVLDIRICVGDKPMEKHFSLVKLAYGSIEGRTVKQEVLRKKLIKLYRDSMCERDQSIQTCRLGNYSMYFKTYKVDGEVCCVFSPIPMADLCDSRRKELEKKFAEFRMRKELWNDNSMIQDI